MLSALEIKQRLNSMGALRIALTAQIPSSVRLVSVEWNTMNPTAPIFYFYYDRTINEQDQEEVEEPFMHVDMKSAEQYEVKLIYADKQLIDYRGDCAYARKEEFSKDTPLLSRERSQCSVTDIDALLNNKSTTVIKSYRNAELQGFGELVDFKQTIGYYLNPTTKEKTATSKAIVYNGKIKRHIIPAVPSMGWLESLQKELKSQNLELSFDAHLYSEANRALLGRIIPDLLAATVIWEPYKLQIHHKDGLSEVDREDLELIWFETLAGVAEKIDLALELQPAKNTYDIPAEGSCFYLKNEPPPNL